VHFDILPIEEKHISGFWEALDSVAREKKYLTFLEGPPIETTRQFVLHSIKSNWAHVIAVDKDKVVGWCDIRSADIRPVVAHVGLLGIGVLASHRGHGVGTALLKAALEKARNNQLTRIELEVRENNKAAIKLYQKMGFVSEGLHQHAACVDGVYENHISMALLYSK
jgi:ribosomal protein S18 acetylase RimI-like enzyme